MKKTYDVSYLAKKFIITINVEGMTNKEINQKLFDEARKEYFIKYK